MAPPIPDVVAIVKASRDGKVNVKREVRDALGVRDGPLYLEVGEEVLLTPRKTRAARPAEMQRNRLCLPGDVAAKLELEAESLVAMIERNRGVALKRLVIEEREGEEPSLTDIETARQVTRLAVTIFMPDELLPRLQKKRSRKRLKHDVKKFLRGRTSLEAWQARKLLKIPDAADVRLREELIKERLSSQDEDGSWQGKVTLTARMLRELSELGVTRKKKEARAGAEWLLARADPVASPGMFLLSDELVALQARCIREGRRFRDRKPKEEALAAEGHPLINRPCGQRILWPNGLALDALVRLGYEKHPRVQAAIWSTIIIGWCECAAQLGADLWRKGGPPTGKEVREIAAERSARRMAQGLARYKYGGVEGAGRLAQVDPNKFGRTLARISHRKEKGKDVYDLNRPPAGDGACDLMSSWGLIRSKDKQARKSAESTLWSLAGAQESDGRIGQRRIGAFLHSGQAAYLETFATLDSPVSKVAILRYIPWIVSSQNKDGSWGDEPHKDITTLYVLRALVSAKDYLPSGLLRW